MSRARVVVVHDAKAITLFEPSLPRVRDMFDRALIALTRTTNVSAAWLSLISKQDTIGIKVISAPGVISGTRPAVVESIVQGLLKTGIPPRQIIIWDAHDADLQTAGYFDLAQRYGVRAIGSAEFGYDPDVFYETPLIGTLRWGDFEFSSTNLEKTGKKSFVSKLVTREMTKIINVTPLLNNNLTGVSGNLFSLTMGSVDNHFRFEADASRMARAVPEIYALRQLGDRVVLNVTDALICQYEGSEHALLHYSVVLNELRLSRDPVALDVLSLNELERQRRAAHAEETPANRELYSNASLLEIGVSNTNKIMIERLP